jgi:hypothetical protein
MLLIDEGLLMYMLSDLIKASLLPPPSITDVIMASLSTKWNLLKVLETGSPKMFPSDGAMLYKWGSP